MLQLQAGVLALPLRPGLPQHSSASPRDGGQGTAVSNKSYPYRFCVSSTLAVVVAGSVARSTFKKRRLRLQLRVLPRPITEDPGGLIDAAKRYLSLGNEVVQQLGPTRREDLEKELADDFEFVAPLVGPLGKKALIAATAGLDLAAALPDFDARYHDFRLDPYNSQRVWCQMRVRGTQTGELKFASITAAPKDPPIKVENPPEAVSITFNKVGKVREITTGYPLDRLSGSTGGLGGLFGVLEGLGYPLPAPLTRTSAEILKPVLGFLQQTDFCDQPAELPVLKTADALPEEKLLELTEKLIGARFGRDDPSLLAKTFICSSPHETVTDKDVFLQRLVSTNIEEAFPDLDRCWRDLRTCPFDTNRVWFTSSPVGTHSCDLTVPNDVLPATGKQWHSPPQCSSVIFNADGECIYLTSGYVMDRRLGNTNGLGGTLGLREAIGMPPASSWLARTPSQLWSSWTS